MPGNRLTDAEVSQRLVSCADEHCVDELYSFGLMMVNESLDTLHRLDAKAYAIAGYSGAAVTALLSLAAFAQKLGAGLISPPLIIFAVFSAVGAAAFSILAIRFRPVDWFSPNEWFHQECLQDTGQLRRYHILCMYGVQRSQRDRAYGKIAHMKWAVRLLLAAGIFLFLSVILSPAFLLQVFAAQTALESLRVAFW
jgi:hypothetical protein